MALKSDQATVELLATANELSDKARVLVEATDTLINLAATTLPTEAKLTLATALTNHQTDNARVRVFLLNIAERLARRETT